jgi:hypothetical protein
MNGLKGTQKAIAESLTTSFAQLTRKSATLARAHSSQQSASNAPAGCENSFPVQQPQQQADDATQRQHHQFAVGRQLRDKINASLLYSQLIKHFAETYSRSGIVAGH